MNRIYQGRVSKLELLDDAKKDPAVLATCSIGELSDPSNPLFRHHEVFQDMVNYYLFAFSALAEELPSEHSLHKLRTQLIATWEKFPKPVTNAHSTQNSITSTLQISPRASYQEAVEVLDLPEDIPRQILALAIGSLVHDLGGDSKIQQGGRSYFPLFCTSKTKANFPRAAINQIKARGKALLPSILWSAQIDSPTETLSQLPFEYFANPSTDGKQLKATAAKQKLQEALSSEDKAYPLEESLKTRLTKTIVALDDTLSFPAYTGGSINKEALKRRFFLYLLLKYVAPEPELFERLRNTFPEPKKILTEYELSDTEASLQSAGDDPIKLARGQRGYVFPAFTALPQWKPDSPGIPVWSELDICAFKEALKTITQFKLKTDERDARRTQAEAEFRFMTGKNMKPKLWKEIKKEAKISENKENSDAAKTPPILADDPRYLRLIAVLKEIQNLIDEDSLNPHALLGPTFSSLRCWRDLRKEWLKLSKAAKGQPQEIDLLQAIAEQQKEHRFDFGYAALYQALAEPKNHLIWQEPSAAEQRQHKEKGWARSVLHAAAEARELAEDITHLKEPIRFTPAEATHSRRLHMLSDMSGSDAVKYEDFGKATISLVVSENGEFRRQRARLHYSAPRLRRDGLDEGSTHSRWLQPLMTGLGIQTPDQLVLTNDGKKAKDPALALMPDWIGRQKELRMLLNFPVTLATEWLQSQISQRIHPAFRWSNFQFNGTRDEQLHLYWPGMTNAPKEEEAWWNHPDIQNNGLTTLSVDIGQRRAGDWAVLQTTASKSEEVTDDKHFLNLGEAGDLHWHVKMKASGNFLLPGEGAKVFLDGKLTTEHYGSRGRRVSNEAEYQQAQDIARALTSHDEELSHWIGTWDSDTQRCSRSFPEQNDGLSKLFSRSLARYRKWQRWTWLIDLDSQKACREIIASKHQALFVPYAGKLKDNTIQGAQIGKLKIALEQEFQTLRNTLAEQINILANRIIPLRGSHWEWEAAGSTPSGAPLHRLTQKDSTAPSPWIKGQRGLSFSRLEQLDLLRRHLLSLNRLFQHRAGKKPDFGATTFGTTLPDPCPELTDKLNRMRNERVNQTAHLILAQALGLRLKPPHQDPALKERDVHGTYEPIPERKPVDFIAIEHLDRYKFDRSRSPRENGKLMKWCHRAIRNKLIEMCEPFGIPVVEVHAAYTSKVDARTGAPGFRASEVIVTDLQSGRWKSIQEKANPTPETYYLRGLVEASKGLPPNAKLRLLMPEDGGAHFLAAQNLDSESPLPRQRQADENAAVNIGLRALASPSCHHAHPRISLQARGNNYVTKTGNKREKTLFGTAQKVEFSHWSVDLKEETGKQEHLTLFHDPASIAQWGFARIPLLKDNPPFALQKSVLSQVKKMRWPICQRINQARLAKHNITFPAPGQTYFEDNPTPQDKDFNDDIPM